jgi:transcription factor MYB, plant
MQLPGRTDNEIKNY